MHGLIDPGNSSLIIWHLYRNTPAGRVLCRLTVDKKTNTIVEEHCAQPAVAVVPTSGTASLHSKLGIPVETVMEGGRQIHIAHPAKAPESTHRLMDFFVESIPCSFPGCAELRQEYFRRLEQLPKDCPPCRVGELMREFMSIILEKQNGASNTRTDGADTIP